MVTKQKKGDNMKKYITKLSKLTTVVAVLLWGFAPALVGAMPESAELFAASTSSKVNEGITAVGGTTSGTELQGLIKNVIGVLLFIAGAVAVIMIIVGGIKYVTSNGDQAHIKSAKDTIMYSIIGLVAAILAFAIVGFVTANIR